MGNVFECVNGVMQMVLMPPKPPNDSLPPPPEDSLLLIGAVELQAPDVQAALRFFVQGLGAEQIGDNAVAVGPSRFVISAIPDGQQAKAWPGHFYVWVLDIQRACVACEALERAHGGSLITERRCAPSGAVNALVLQDPCTSTLLSVNQAPAPLIEKGLQNLGRVKDAPEGTNAVAVMECVCTVPKGTARALCRFYSRFFGAAVREYEGSCVVCFAPGATLTQTLRFNEDDKAAEPQQSLPTFSEGGEAVAAQESLPHLCIYMPSEAKFRKALGHGRDIDILLDSAVPLEGATEFQISGCFDLEAPSKKLIYAMRHTVRSPGHKECPVAAQCEGDEAEACIGA